MFLQKNVVNENLNEGTLLQKKILCNPFLLKWLALI